MGGGIGGQWISAQITDCLFNENSAKVGGGLHFIQLTKLIFNRNQFIRNSADYSAGAAFDFHEADEYTSFRNLNFSQNTAKLWTGGIRIDHCGGEFLNSIISDNSALVCGGFFDYSWIPCKRNVSRVCFLNNTSQDKGGGVTLFHICHHSTYQSCVFVGNRCTYLPDSLALESISCVVNLVDSCFDEGKELALGMRYPDNQLNIDPSTQFLVNVEDSLIQDKKSEIINKIVPPHI